MYTLNLVSYLQKTLAYLTHLQNLSWLQKSFDISLMTETKSIPGFPLSIRFYFYFISILFFVRSKD